MDVRRLSNPLTWLVAALALLTVLASYRTLSQTAMETGQPFGVFGDPDTPGRITIVDFPTHLNFARHFWADEPARPYTMEAQREMVLDWVPTASSGMPFAYSPVALVLSAPLVSLSTGTAFLVWGLLNVAAVTTLWRLYLAPRMQGPPDLLLALVATLSLSLFSTLFIGQTSVLTTAALAGIWALLWDFSRQAWRPLTIRWHVLLAVLLFLMASKPSIAVAAAALLFAARAWWALGLAALLGLAAGLAMSGELGGFPQWIWDYRALLNGYHQAAIGDFMRPGIPPHILTSLLGFLDQWTAWGAGFHSALCQYLWLGGTAGLVAGAMRGWLSAAHVFRLNLLWFLIFCPHVSATEDWVLALALVEPLARASTSSARQRRPLWMVELVLVMIAVNFRQGVPLETLALAPALFAKLGLLGLWSGAAIRASRNG